ncbi:MAG: cupin domain-containing protein [Candidatus Sulfotelmatobacter sp.]
MRLRFVVSCAALCFFVAAVAVSQDAAKVDPKHYKVELENAQVRVLRFHYGPHEKSVMHSHPNTVAVFLNDGKIRFTFPDGKTQDVDGKAGEVQYTAAQVHNPENTGVAPMDGIVVELKGTAGK